MKQDYREAVRWYRKVADQGHASAQCNLGNMHFEGRGVEQVCTEAARWYRKAADQGNAGAKQDLGVVTVHVPGAAARPAHTQDHSTRRDMQARSFFGGWLFLLFAALFCTRVLFAPSGE